CQSNSFEKFLVRSVEITDSATRLNLLFVNRPNNWCSIDSLKLESDISGRKYGLRGVENYEFGKRQYMPESGMHQFTAVFEPLLPSDTIVNLTDGVCMVTDMDVSGNPPSAKYHTHISGTYPKSETFLMLTRAEAKHSFQDVIWVPVTDGKFSTDIYSDKLEAYEITDEFGSLKGYWTSGFIFSENTDASVNYPVKDGEVERAVVTAPEGSLTYDYNLAHQHWVESIENHPSQIRYDSLYYSKNYYIPEYYEIEDRLKTHPEEKDTLAARVNKLYESGDILTSEGRKAYNDLMDWVENGSVRNLHKEAVDLNNLAGLFILQKEMWGSEKTSAVSDAYHNHYAGKFPGHPYSQYFEVLDISVDPIPGNHYNDFSAPDINGVMHTLSDEIKGHYAIIDLWASWCGGCRRTSKSMIPIYEEFSPKGFKIVGVARESGNTDFMAKAIVKDGYPWLNLVEIDDAQSLWAKYRCPGAGGKVLLVNPDGKIILVNPTAQEVKAILSHVYPSN
ncbi:MAG: TlpA family protein disulfide reductase, partial [Muribaculaceae bacterium]|nr:TlpA family protein disulfide reductase [Muribaculaceae bacterium]